MLCLSLKIWLYLYNTIVYCLEKIWQLMNNSFDDNINNISTWKTISRRLWTLRHIYIQTSNNYEIRRQMFTPIWNFILELQHNTFRVIFGRFTRIDVNCKHNFSNDLTARPLTFFDHFEHVLWKLIFGRTHSTKNKISAKVVQIY